MKIYCGCDCANLECELNMGKRKIGEPAKYQLLKSTNKCQGYKPLVLDKEFDPAWNFDRPKRGDDYERLSTKRQHVA